MAKVSENLILQNFEKKIFAIFSTAVSNFNFVKYNVVICLEEICISSTLK